MGNSESGTHAYISRTLNSVITISASKLKAQRFSVLDRVDENGIIITRRGRPVAKLIHIPISSVDLIGALRGKLRINGKVFSTGERWHAQG
jgi:prevent-host-death family protein